MLEIKLRTIATAAATGAAGTGAGACVAAATAMATVYMIEDAGTCTFTQPQVVFYLKLHLYPVC